MRTLNLDHPPAERRQVIRQMMAKYCFLWNGQLSQINTVEHHITIPSESHSCMHRPYRAETAAKASIRKEMEAMQQQGMIEEAQSK